MNPKEFFTTTGENLLKKVKELIEEGNVRRITITEKSGRELMSIPLTMGVVGAMLAPILAAIGALAALIGECTITVERDGEVKAEAIGKMDHSIVIDYDEEEEFQTEHGYYYYPFLNFP